MGERAASVLVEGLRFPEGPRWHDGRLWCSDQHDRKVVAIGTDGSVETIVEVPQCPSGLGWTPDGRLLIVSMHDRKLLRLDSDGLTEVADLSGHAPFHCNDMVVDSHGRAYIGNFGFDLDGGGAAVSTVVMRVDPDGTLQVAADEIRFPNGTVITPDGATLIVGESYGGCLTAFDVAADGALSNRRVWAKLHGAVPDGICLDEAGAIWSVCPLTGRVLRVLEGGEVTDEVTVSRNGAYACMLGGADGRTLFICAADASDPVATGTMRGAIETLTVEVPHAGLP